MSRARIIRTIEAIIRTFEAMTTQERCDRQAEAVELWRKR